MNTITKERNLSAEDIKRLPTDDWFLDSSLEITHENAIGRCYADIPPALATHWRKTLAEVSRDGHMTIATKKETDTAVFLHFEFPGWIMSISYRKNPPKS